MSALIWPLRNYTVTSPYGPRGGGFHHGIDLGAPLGTAIYAAADGTVMASGSASGFGDWIILDHIIDGKKISTVYGHMYPDGLLVHTGQIVRKGDHIANVGANGEATGPHCHFEVWVGGRLTGGHDVDPMTYLGAGSAGGMTVQTVGDTTSNPVTSTVDTVTGISQFVDFVTTPHNWWRMFLFLGGTAFMLYVIWSLTQGSAR